MELLDLLDEMNARELIDKKTELFRDYIWLKNGELGELVCLDWLQKELGPVVIYHNLELDYNGRTQVDLLVVADNVWWVVEVKNYQGVFEYQDQTGKLRGRSMHTDPIASMRNRMRIMKDLAQTLDNRIVVEGSMIFINPDSEARVNTSENFYIIMRHQFKRHISEIRQKYNFAKNRLSETYYRRIMQYHSPYPVELPVISEADWDRMRKGCRCPQCNSYNLVARKKFMDCADCGAVTAKSELAKDLYCQLCVLMYDQPKGVTMGRLLELSNFQLSRTTLNNVLKPHVPKYHRNKYAYFKNNKLPKTKFKSLYSTHNSN